MYNARKEKNVKPHERNRKSTEQGALMLVALLYRSCGGIGLRTPCKELDVQTSFRVVNRKAWENEEDSQLFYANCLKGLAFVFDLVNRASRRGLYDGARAS